MGARGLPSRLGSGIILTSYENVTVANVVSGNVTVHNWIYDLATGELEEILAQERLAPFQYCSAILPSGRIAVNAMLDGEERIFTADLDGRNAHALTAAGEGFCYGIRLSPDGEQLAFHVTGGKFEKDARQGGSGRDRTASTPCAPMARSGSWSPGSPGTCISGRTGRRMANGWFSWIVTATSDPADFWADLCIGRADDSDHRVVTLVKATGLGRLLALGNAAGEARTWRVLDA